MKKYFLLLFIPIILGAFALPARAAESRSFTIVAVAATKPPRLDGTLSDPEWKSGAHVQLQWDLAFRRPAEDATDAYVLVDAKYVYVAFDAHQNERIIASQHTNDQPLSTDDAVRVYFWPAGDGGNEYEFAANPIGTRYAFSTENTAFAPVWTAVATRTADGYIVTERIPLDVMRGDGRGTWRVQFDRSVRSSNELLEWAQNPAQGSSDTNLYAGYMTGMQLVAKNARTKPRLSIYTLGEAAAPSAGGSTSRAGADLSIPLTQTSSFVATFHPDYSIVELDQQSISPTAFPRRFSEVRPFFTQGSGYYNRFNCNDCLNYPLLYTPAIPTPRDGYALEGTQGQMMFGAFDAIGAGRTDNAQSMQWRSNDRHYEAIYQRVGVDMPGLHDVTEYFQPIVGNYHNFSAYATLGNETGSLVATPGQGRYREYGVNFYTPKSGIYAAYHDVGAQYAPIDGFNQISDAHGPTVYAQQEFDNGPKSFIQSVIVSQDFGLMRDHTGVLDYAYNSSYITVATRNRWFFGWNFGDNYLRFPGQPGGFTNQNGLQLTYDYNGATPSGVTYNIGRYGAGYLRSVDLKAAFHLGHAITFSAEAYKTGDAMDSGARLTQWLERASVAYPIGPGQSLAFGLRKIIGTAPPFFNTPQFLNATNLSMAYYRRWSSMELYAAYGDPNQLATQHDFIVKLIRYFGAEKGT
jgi:hypothetical protein